MRKAKGLMTNCGSMLTARPMNASGHIRKASLQLMSKKRSEMSVRISSDETTIYSFKTDSLKRLSAARSTGPS